MLVRAFAPVVSLWRNQRRAMVELALGVALILTMIAGPTLFGMATESKRLDPSLSGSSQPVNLVVTMDFEPRGFHLRTLQQFGVFGGKISDTKVRLFQVPPDGLQGLSRTYWITSIVPAPGP